LATRNDRWEEVQTPRGSKRVPNQDYLFDRRPRGDDRDDVYPPRKGAQVMLCDELRRSHFDVLLFAPVDEFPRFSEIPDGSRLDFDEDEDIAVVCNEVQFA